MMFTRTVAPSAALLALVVTGGSREPRLPARLPPGWIAVESPDRQADEYTCAYWHDTTWHVALTRDSTALKIDVATQDADITTIDVPGGRLIGYNGGEFGGLVAYIANNGHATELVRKNLTFFLPTDDGILGLGGIAHLGFNQGWLVRFKPQSDGVWTAETVMSLDGEPVAFSRLADDTLLVVIVGGVEVLRPATYKTVVFRDTLLPFVDPHSVVRDRAGVIYLGMRHAVARLRPHEGGYADDWIVPAQCPTRVRTAETGKCRCAARRG